MDTDENMCALRVFFLDTSVMQNWVSIPSKVRSTGIIIGLEPLLRVSVSVVLQIGVSAKGYLKWFKKLEKYLIIWP